MKGELSDEDLARASRLGDLAAFRTLVERHRRRIYSLALRMVRNRTEAEDMAQEAFLRVFRGLPGFRGDSAFSTWMTRVALNTFHRHLRRMPREAELPRAEEALDRAAGSPTSPGGSDPEAHAAASQQAEQVRRLVAGLPAHLREAVALFYLEERSLEEIASTLGVSLGTVKSRLFRAREMLLRRWQEQVGPAGGRQRAGAPGEKSWRPQAGSQAR